MEQKFRPTEEESYFGAVVLQLAFFRGTVFFFKETKIRKDLLNKSVYITDNTKTINVLTSS